MAAPIAPNIAALKIDHPQMTSESRYAFWYPIPGEIVSNSGQALTASMLPSMSIRAVSPLNNASVNKAFITEIEFCALLDVCGFVILLIRFSHSVFFDITIDPLVSDEFFAY